MEEAAAEGVQGQAAVDAGRGVPAKKEQVFFVLCLTFYTFAQNNSYST